jgi:hypothetical protein
MKQKNYCLDSISGKRAEDMILFLVLNNCLRWIYQLNPPPLFIYKPDYKNNQAYNMLAEPLNNHHMKKLLLEFYPSIRYLNKITPI